MLHDLWAAVFGYVIGQRDDPACPSDKVHCPAHAFYYRPGDGPVREITACRDLESPKDGDVNMSTPDHRERLGGIEVRAAATDRHGLLTRVDEVGVFVAVVGERAHAEQAVFAVQGDANVLRNVVGNEATLIALRAAGLLVVIEPEG
jgi:hypothetical protein